MTLEDTDHSSDSVTPCAGAGNVTCGEGVPGMDEEDLKVS